METENKIRKNEKKTHENYSSWFIVPLGSFLTVSRIPSQNSSSLSLSPSLLLQIERWNEISP